jgi:Fe-S-cluster-containing hydrogenase component 2
MTEQLVKRRIFAQEEKCNGCRICELRCSFYHEKLYAPSHSRIRIKKVEVEGTTIPETCRLCYKCIESCPEDAISKSEITGAIQIDEQKCTGCEECVKACPFGVMHMHPVSNIAMTCDLCDGNPQCVIYCPETALHYITAKEFSEYKKKEKENIEAGRVQKFSPIPK